MTQDSSFILSAPFILPIDQPLLKNASLVIQNDSILDLGDSKTIQKKYNSKFFFHIDCPKTVLLPGFVNAHSHLELSCFKDFDYPGNFTEWIRKVVELKPNLSEENYQEGIQQGITSMLESGITTIGDHVSFNTDLEFILKSPFRGILFIEVLGVVKEIAENILVNAENLENSFQDFSSLFQVYASPHSVHAVHPEILLKLFSKKRNALSIHLGESEDEKEYFKNQSGPLHEFIFNRDNSRMAQPCAPTALQYLESQHLLSNQIMAVHCNYLDEKDLNLLEKHQISVVHCPASHGYFSHQKFPLEKLKKKKINIALGTDSLSSGNSLSMLDQIRLAKKSYPDISSEDWIQMTTLNGAKALKIENQVGSLTPGKKADLIGFYLEEKSSKNLYEQIIDSKKVNLMMINGKRVNLF